MKKYLLIPIILFSLLLCGFGEQVVPSSNTLEQPRFTAVVEQPYVIPKEMRSESYPAEHQVVYTDVLSIDELKGDEVYAESDNFFVVGQGQRRNALLLHPGVNTFYIVSRGGKKETFKKQRVLRGMQFKDVPKEHPAATAIQYLYMLRIMNGYEDEGGAFLPDNGVPTEEFSEILNQVSKDRPQDVTFSRLGAKNYIDRRQAIDAIQYNFGEPDISWSNILGENYGKLNESLTRAELARLLTHLKPVQEKMAALKKEFNLRGGF